MSGAKKQNSKKNDLGQGITVDESGEVLHHGPLATRQNYENYTEENHAVWALLYSRQRENLNEIGYKQWLEAGDKIKLSADRIPKLSEVGRIIHGLTGWRPVPISGFLDAKDYFWYLKNRQFPTVTTLRTREQLEFIVEPDLFHDAFGHLPMHTHPVFADFLQLFGEVACQAETEEQITQMQRLYWFTVEYCLIREKGELKVCGSGHFSGIKEARYSLTDEVEKRPFDLENVIHQDFNPHILQKIMYVIDSYDQLYEAMETMAKRFGLRR